MRWVERAMTRAILGCIAFWLVLGTLAFLALQSWTALYTGALALALIVEVQAQS
jgi:hypothetical protein